MITSCTACRQLVMPDEWHTRQSYSGPCLVWKDKPREPNDTWEIWRFFNVEEEGT